MNFGRYQFSYEASRYVTNVGRVYAFRFLALGVLSFLR
jgi:hypothetical protein